MVHDVTSTGIVVQKYGGSSVADADKIKLVAQRIARTKAAGKKVVVVVSAMGKTTNSLIEKAKAISASPSRRELDMLLTCGEREAMALLTMACAEEGVEAISFTGSQAGILTNDRHSGARIVEVRPFRIEDDRGRARRRAARRLLRDLLGRRRRLHRRPANRRRRAIAAVDQPRRDARAR